MTQTDERHPREAVAVLTPGQQAIARANQWTNAEAKLIAATIAPGLSENQLKLFAKVCERSGKDPFRREIYGWVASGKLCIHIGIQGWRQDAIATGEYLGQLGPEWCGEDGVWKDVWLSDKPPAAARCGVMRRGFPEPLYATVTWREFARKTPTWQEMGAHMLGVRAEYHALQRAFADAYQETVAAIKESGAELVVTDEDVPRVIDTGTGEVLDLAAPRDETVSTAAETQTVEPLQPPDYPWVLELHEELATASLDVAALGVLLGRRPGYKAIDAWLTAQSGRTPRDLVMAAADALAAKDERR